MQFPILDHTWGHLPKTFRDPFKIYVTCASMHRVPTCDTAIPVFVTPVFWTVWVPTLAVGSCFTVILLTLPGVKVLGVVIVVEAPTGAVTGVTAGILTVTAGLGLIGVEIDDWEMVRATTGLARTWACCKQHKDTERYFNDKLLFEQFCPTCVYSTYCHGTFCNKLPGRKHFSINIFKQHLWSNVCHS